MQAKVTLDSKDYDSILYAPRGESSKISIATTLAKSLMDKDSKIQLAEATTKAENIIKKADKPETILKVYNDTLNSDIAKDLISTSIRGLVSVITDKLESKNTITENTTIEVTKEEVEKANNQIKEPAGNTQLTPLQKVTEIFNNAEVKADKNNPVNLNEHLDNSYDVGLKELGIKHDAFGKFPSIDLLTKQALFSFVDYKKEGWPSDSIVSGLEIFSNRDDNNENMKWYSLGHYNFENVNICASNGKVNGVYYKPLNVGFIDELFKCYDVGKSEDEDLSENDIRKISECYINLIYNNKDKFTVETYYWTIDTTLLDKCKNN